MKLTHHAKQRAYERLGIPPALLLVAASTVMASGTPLEEIQQSDPKLHSYLLSLLARHRHDHQGGRHSTLRVASEHAWIWVRSACSKRHRRGGGDHSATDRSVEDTEWVLITIRPLRSDWASRTPRTALRFIPLSPQLKDPAARCPTCPT